MMMRMMIAVVAVLTAGTLAAQTVDSVAGKRVVFLGDSITQSGRYIAYVDYYLQKGNPEKEFDLLGLGLASETLSGLSEEGHAGGKFPRPCLFERLGRLLEKAEPEVVFACYGMNDGIYKPLDAERFGAFKAGVEKLIARCKEAGVKEVFLVTPPIYDHAAKAGEVDYDAVLAEYAKWEAALRQPGVRTIDLHTAMRAARDSRKEPFARDKVHPGDEGHLVMARAILAGLGVKPAEEGAAEIAKDPLFELIAKKHAKRSPAWMNSIGYTREVKVEPKPLGTAEWDAMQMQKRIDELRRAK